MSVGDLLLMALVHAGNIKRTVRRGNRTVAGSVRRMLRVEPRFRPTTA
jgi:hypothetical protein